MKAKEIFWSNIHPISTFVALYTIDDVVHNPSSAGSHRLVGRSPTSAEGRGRVTSLIPGFVPCCMQRTLQSNQIAVWLNAKGIADSAGTNPPDLSLQQRSGSAQLATAQDNKIVSAVNAKQTTLYQFGLDRTCAWVQNLYTSAISCSSWNAIALTVIRFRIADL